MATPEKVNLAEKLGRFTEHWSPKAIGAVNDFHVKLVKLQGEQAVPDTDHNGAVLVKGEPKGPKMGWMKLKRGHQALLPKNSAYRFKAAKPAVVVLQTCKGDLSIERWAEICQTA